MAIDAWQPGINVLGGKIMKIIIIIIIIVKIEKE